MEKCQISPGTIQDCAIRPLNSKKLHLDPQLTQKMQLSTFSRLPSGKQ